MATKEMLFLFAATCCAISASAAEYSFDNDYLTPTPYEEFNRYSYDQALRMGFDDILGTDVILRTVSLPDMFESYGPEFAFALRRNGASYNGVYYRYPTTLWYASPGGVPTGEIVPNRWECPISAPRADQIMEVWTRVLVAMPADAERSGYTDTSIHWFVLNGEDGELRGMTWSPAPDSVPGLMVNLAENLGTYCRTSNWWFGFLIREWFGAAADNRAEEILVRLGVRP